jgi:ComF family protein
MRRFLREMAVLLLPVVCARCGGTPADSEALCTACQAALTRWPERLGREERCRLCQQAPAPPLQPVDPPRPTLRPALAGRCAACAERGGPLLACIAAAPFAGEVAEWIRRFKYPRPGLAGLDPAAEAVAGALILDAARGLDGPAPDAVVPIPLHPARLRARGFHPAANLARALARRHRLRFAPDALERVLDTPSQTGLDRAARRRNVAAAFRPAAGRRGRPGRRVWLVDDVVTTGATLEQAARVLRRAGAREVVALVAGRTPGAD